jgi:hypothetical protein
VSKFNPSHPCEYPGCDKSKARIFLMCGRHWRRVPVGLRSQAEDMLDRDPITGTRNYKGHNKIVRKIMRWAYEDAKVRA